MTAGERLALLAGQSGAAAVLLLVIGTGATAGEALADYSGLTAVTAAEHLLFDVVADVPRPGGGGGGGGGGYQGYEYTPQKQPKPDILALQIAREDIEVTEFIQALMASGILDGKLH